MIATYLVLAQIGVGIFFRPRGGPSLSRVISRAERRIVAEQHAGQLATPHPTNLTTRNDHGPTNHSPLTAADRASQSWDGSRAQFLAGLDPGS